ncbi:MAG: BCAM0308 family protein [Candidatus Bipolaricaulia bacterium]
MREGEKRGRIGGGSTDPYHEGRKYPEPTACPRCHLVYRNGRWQTAEAEDDEHRVNESHCPACRREIDLLPGGLLFLSGDYLSGHKKEILSIARNQAVSAASHRPLQRIMWIEEDGENTEIATTNGHLALRIGKAIESACKGSLDIKHAHGDQLVRVYWKREG